MIKTKKISLEGLSVSEHKDYTLYEWDDARVELDKETERTYLKALNRGKPFAYRIRQFLTASNKAGRQAKVLKDFALMFFPWGDKVETLTELVAHQIKRTMPDTPKKKTESKTIIVYSLLLIVSILYHFGIDLGLEVSPDAAWVASATSVIGILLRLVTSKPVELSNITKTLLAQHKEE